MYKTGNNNYDVFIAYYGDDVNGTEGKAIQICNSLRSIGINAYCKPVIDSVGTFSETPRIVQRTPLFLLVVDSNIPKDENGQLLEKNPNGETKQLYLEVKAFRSSQRYLKANDTGMVAKLYIIGDFSYSDAGNLDPLFSGITHFREKPNDFSNTLQSVADWIKSTLEIPEDSTTFFSDVKLYEALLKRDEKKKYISNIDDLYNVMAKQYHKIPDIIGYDIDHSARHVKRILNTLAELLGDYLEYLSDIEVTFLITGALIHDVGLCASREHLESLLSLDGIEGSDLRLSNVERNLFNGNRNAAIRYVFERTRDLRIESIIDSIGAKCFFSGYYENYFQDVLDCISIHDNYFQDDASRLIKKTIDGMKIDLAYISVLLHIADVLDYDITGTLEERSIFDLSKYVQCSEKDSGIPSLIISNITNKTRRSINLNYDDCSSCNKCPIEIYIQPLSYRELRPRIKNEFRNKDEDIYNFIQCRIIEYKEYLEREIQKCKYLMNNNNSNHKLKLEDRVDYVKVESTTPNYKIDIDYSTTVSLLLGEHIYGNRRVGLREIIQNSLDACKYRLERTKNQHIYHPSISIEMNKLSNEISITDNGIGMNRYVIENYFLKIGQSLYDSEKYLESNSQFLHAGHYGIGFFSAFMLSDVVLITTRHMDDSVSWSVRVTTEGRYASISKENTLSDIGTSITLAYDQVEKNFNIYNEPGFDLLYEMKSYISRFFLADIKDNIPISITIHDLSDTTNNYHPKEDSIIDLESVHQLANGYRNYYDLSSDLSGMQCVMKADVAQEYKWYKYCIGEDGVESFIQVNTKELGIYDSIIYKKIFHGEESICVYIPPEYWNKNTETREPVMPFNYDDIDRQAIFAAKSEKVFGNISIEDLFKIVGWRFPNELNRKPITAFIGKYYISRIGENVIVYVKNKSIEHREPNEGATLNGRQFRDDVYIRNVYIPNFHIKLPYIIFCVNDIFLPEIKKMIINIEDGRIFPTIDRNDVPIEMKEIVSKKICHALFGWFGKTTSEEKAIEDFCEYYKIY